MRIEDNYLVFSTGKKYYANGGIIGIDKDLDLTEGCDNGMNDDELTNKEKVELANFMIDLWKKYKNREVK